MGLNLIFFPQQPTRLQWQKVFYIAAGVYLFGALVFTVFASGKEQKWNHPLQNRLLQVSIDREDRKPLPVFCNPGVDGSVVV